MKHEDTLDVISDAITDSLEPDWNPRSCALHIMQWLDCAGLEITRKPINMASPGSNEWLMQSPNFHYGDIA